MDGGQNAFLERGRGQSLHAVDPLARTSEIAEGRLTKSFELLSSPN